MFSFPSLVFSNYFKKYTLVFFCSFFFSHLLSSHSVYHSRVYFHRRERKYSLIKQDIRANVPHPLRFSSVFVDLPILSCDIFDTSRDPKWTGRNWKNAFENRNSKRDAKPLINDHQGRLLGSSAPEKGKSKGDTDPLNYDHRGHVLGFSGQEKRKGKGDGKPLTNNHRCVGSSRMPKSGKSKKDGKYGARVCLWFFCALKKGKSKKWKAPN